MDSFEIKDIFCHKRLRQLDLSPGDKRIITLGESSEKNMKKLMDSISKVLPSLQESKSAMKSEASESSENIIVH